MDLMALVPEGPPQVEDFLIPPRIVHNCRMPKEDNEIDSLVKGTRIIDKMRRWIIRKSVLSKNHPIIKSWVKSSTAINYEISRHLRSYPYMIYPFSDLRTFWESFLTIFTIFSMIFIPFLLSFYFDRLKNSLSIFIIVDFVFIVDILLSFFTGYYDDTTRIIVLDRKIVASKYLKGFFTLDLLSAIPIELFYVILTGSENAKLYCTAFNLTKIFRLRNIVSYSRRLRHFYRISFQMYKVIEMSTIIGLSIHWASCLELYVALAAREIDWTTSDRGSWLDSKRMKDKDTKFKLYIACINRATVSLVSSSHYLEVKTIEDILLNLFLTVVGRMGFIYIVAQFLQLMRTFHTMIKRKAKLLQQLQEYMKYKELPYGIQRRLLDYHKYCSNKNYERDKYIIDNVSSPQLRDELLLHNYSRLLVTVDYFRYIPQSVLAKIIAFLRTEVYLTNDVIVKIGTTGDALHFVASGTVAVYTNSGKEVCHLEDGSHFGDASLVMESDQRIANIVAVENCEIWTLRRADFLQCVAPYPNILNHLRKIAVERLEKNLLSTVPNRQTI